MRVVGTITTELVYTRPARRAFASAVVPTEALERLEAERQRLGHRTQWWYDDDPHTGERRPAFTPIEGGRLALIESRGIRHGDRFVGSFEVKEVTRQGVTRREMWLVDAQPIAGPGPA